MPRKDMKLSARVDRLVSGKYRSDDLNYIFLALRQTSYGRPILVELGDFIAHNSQREKGICTERFIDFYKILPTYVKMGGKRLNVNDLPEDIASFLGASYRMIGPELIAKKTKLRKNGLSKLLSSLITRVGRNNSTKLSFLTRPNDEELRLFNFLTNGSMVEPAFNDKGLLEDFWHSLTKNGLVSAVDKPKILAQKNAIVAFAIASMHQCKLIDKNQGVEATIECRVYDGNLIAMSSMLVPYIPVPVSMPIFMTGVPAKDVCMPDLQGKALQITWDCSLELNDELKLARLGSHPAFEETTIVLSEGGNIRVSPKLSE